MNKKVIIIGAGGHGKVVADIVEKSGDTVYGFLDDGCDERSEFLGFPFLGKTDDCEKYINEAEFVIAIGKADIRDKIAQRLKGAKLYTAVHPSAVISSIDVAIGEGTVIMANAVVNPGSRIGRHCIINTGAIVERMRRMYDTGGSRCSGQHNRKRKLSGIAGKDKGINNEKDMLCNNHIFDI